MKKRILNKTNLCTVILLTLLNFAVVEGLGNNTENNFQPVLPDQMSGILTMISNETQSNYDKIKTWQGKVDATIGAIYEGTEAERVFKNKTDGAGKVPKKVKRLAESVVEFATDYEKGLFFDKKFYPSPLRYIDPNSGGVLGTKSTVGSTITIATPEYRITTVPLIKRKDVIITRQAVKEKRTSQEGCSTCGDDVFDPRYEAIDGEAFRQTFLFLLNYIEKHGEFNIDGQSLRIEERVDGTTTEYRIEIPSPQTSPGEFVFTTMIFNSDKGFNITLSETRSADSKLNQKMTWDYEVIDGIYLPTRTMLQNFHGQNAELSYERECVYTNLLNKTIPENTFSDENCGLREGEKLIDKTNNKKEFVLKQGKFVEFKKQEVDKKKDDLSYSVGQEVTNPALFVVSSTPELPAKLKVGERLVFDVFYDLPKEFEHAGIRARPYTNGKRTPGYKAHKAIRVSKNEPSGIVKCWFSFEKPTTVNEVRFHMVDLSGNIIHTGAMPVDAEWINDK